jgi:hypothetical protein
VAGFDFAQSFLLFSTSSLLLLMMSLTCLQRSFPTSHRKTVFCRSLRDWLPISFPCWTGSRWEGEGNAAPLVASDSWFLMTWESDGGLQY